MVNITVSSAGRSSLTKALPISLDLGKDVNTATVADVKVALAAKFPKLYVERQKVSLKDDKKTLADESTLASVGLSDGGELALKDLGPQINWKTIFLVEYAGPLVIHPLVYHFSDVFYRGPVQHSQLQKYMYAMVLAHFAKRELETLFVHRFSHATMPAFNIIKNSAHYHFLAGLFIAYPVYSPTYSANSPYIVGTIRDNPNFLLGCVAVWLFSELSNLKTHWTLRNLRPAGTRRRALPYGYGFSLVSCPNYFFELVAWVVISVMTGSWAAWLFTVVATGQMAVWAQKKHRAYKKEFGKEMPRGRKAMIPFIF
ncbi:3-oxo-5-alpha-steroid 4-dehydrogenase-domain-containing protein [Amylostereum chailletii]|nr:3-oxo-5-alpha-steroid 4-dehydrogenase-domain-containing protein [Amylostereum chailletii]